ncbi:hypothetical protein [Pedobacter suwonensis]|uniref:hypothetical protein n=1 Tax=Pedobacter suwonensis TaxID=332999 RepID=UPI0011A58441|nr:hypothetical protein [Pedobacter suwonensis]
MSTDKHYWKDAYKEFWDISSEKEKTIKSIIEKSTGMKVIEIGLGAGTADYIRGNALDNNLQIGDADLYIPEKDIYIEVTGPNIPLDFNLPLWIRPDKLNNTRAKLKSGKGKLHVVFHILTQKGTGKKIIRVIKLDEEFYKYLDAGHFKIAKPFIRGRYENYIELPPEHVTILTLDEFLALVIK